MTQNDANILLCIDKITRLISLKNFKLEHYVYLRVYLQIFKTHLYRSVKRSFYKKLYRLYLI